MDNLNEVNEIKKPIFKKAKVKIEDYINDGTVYVVHGWMVKRLNLKGNEKDIFAIIHSFSQNELGYFYGSKNYLAKYVSCDESTVKNNLKSLEEKGFITRYGEEYTGSNQRVYYVSNVNPEKLINGEHTLETYKKLYEEVKKQKELNGVKITPVKNYPGCNAPDPIEKNTDPGVKISHNNIDTSLDTFKNVVVTDREIEDKIYCAVLTKEEYLNDLKSLDFSKYAKQTSLSMIEMTKQLSLLEKKKFMNLSEDKILKIYQDCFESKHNIYGSFKNSDGFVKSKIKQALVN